MVPLHLRPASRDREELMIRLNKLLREGRDPVVVLTQVVGASVVISVVDLVTELAPIDSIVQMLWRVRRIGYY